ncbi:16S rRNA (cytidine(1402)-2'-O)-methyltransferase [Parvularcula sp. ZS-1/3]|uniref:Ribosomal RNA small subunit methyltransferase I n=1 Tax=Parvularcula mediterranea TaxID=2732508 RepID=A0A7Y3RL82_9PROT|nr:16S rRNA (cytidine(1402)-2'-O)-methyltransferase [Parvularcula mediterranea]
MSDFRQLKPLQPGLHVAATPIGNLGDITRRVEQALVHADRVLCEDTRVTGKLYAALGLERPPLTPYHEHNAAEVRPQIIADLKEGKAIVLVSDAGTPLISDPGYKIVREARDEGIPVFTLPGASALTAALSIAGAPTDRFTFYGFLPKPAMTQHRLFSELKSRGETAVFYESGPRLAASLDMLDRVLGPRRVSICRELTKLHEEVVEGYASELSERYRDQPPKGEIVLVVHPPEKDYDAPSLDDVLARLMATESLRESARMAAEITGLPKKECYARALALKEAGG